MNPKPLACITLVAALAAPSARTEVIEEIVAKVNDDIITMSELEREEQALVADLYRQFTGAELDRQVAEARSILLQSLIDTKLLVHRAERIYDIDKMEDALLETFMDRENIDSVAQLERMLAEGGLSVSALKRRLVEMHAPQEVIRFEVAGRLAVGDAEIEAYYAANPEEFVIPAEVTLQEIVLLAPGAEQDERMAEAEAIRQLLLAEGADFATIAAEKSEAGSADQGGRIGPFKKGDLVEVLDDAAFTLPVGVISPILETENGLHVIEVVERTDDTIITLEEVKEKLRVKIEDDNYSKALKEYLEKARQEADIWINPKYRAKYSVQTSG